MMYFSFLVYLLDDILSALDTHVVSHVIRHCILGLLKTKTRIIVTENKTLFYYANQVLHVENGCVEPSEIVNGSFDSAALDFEKSEEEINESVIDLSENNADKKSLDSVMMHVKKTVLIFFVFLLTFFFFAYH